MAPPKEYFYELRAVEPNSDCANCGYPIHGPDAVWFAMGGIPGPFCRPECALLYHGIKKGKMRRKKEENGD